MQEVDNAAGSYLPGSGNLIAVGNWTFFPLSATVNLIQGEKFQFTHKSVLTAFAINPNLWPANGSMTLDMQAMNLMFNEFNYNPNLPSNNYGYPNLGRPNDHFQVTPFEAIYVDNLINPHIRYVDPTDAPDAIEVTNFMLNEIEPSYLGLQNSILGSKVRSNYVYHSYRRAEHQIVVGHLVTPTTDPGDYVTEPNAVLTLKAGDEINLKPGVHFKAGSIVHIIPEYDVCDDEKSANSGTRHLNSETNAGISNTLNDVNQQRTTDILLYPNPAKETVNIRTTDSQEMTEISCFDLFGHQVFHQSVSGPETQIAIQFMEKGVYFVKITLADCSSITKQLQKL